MKRKFTFLIAALMLLTMITMPVKVWAENVEVTYDFTNNNNYSINTTTKTITYNDGTEEATFTYSVTGTDNCQKQTGIQWGAGKVDAGTITINTSVYNTYVIIQVDIQATSTTDYNATVSVGETPYTAASGNSAFSSTAHTNTYTGNSSGNTQIVLSQSSTKKNVIVKSITITYTTGGGTTTDPTITFNDGSVYVGNTLDLSTLFTSNSSGTVTYSITAGNDYATLNNSTLTGVAAGSVTVQASQAAAGNYNAKAVTATITVSEAPVLSSIAITTAPTKTTYDEGETFDPSGMVVTATYSNSTTDDVTESCTWTPDGALETTDTEITVSYTENNVTKTATQTITVNDYVQPTEFDIALCNSLFGTTYSGSVSGITDDNPIVGSYKHVAVTYAGSGNHYVSNSQIRFYPNNKLTFVAPVGYNIKKIVFTADGTWAATIGSNSGTYTANTKTWEGKTASVIFTGSGSSRCDISKAAITLEVKKVLSSISLSGTYSTTFHVGDAFSHDGIIVTANYDDATTEDVTAKATFSEPDMSTTGVKTVTVSYTEDDVEKTTTYDITVNAAATLESISLSGTYPTVFDKDDAFSSEGIVVTANYDDETSTIVTGDAEFSGYNMSTVGEQTVTVSYGGKSASYSIIVLATGTESNPYTVAQALANTPSSGTSAYVYIHGIVSKFFKSDITSDGSNYRYYISDDGSETNQLLVYGGKDLNNETFENANDLLVGDIVTIYGRLTIYSQTKEIASGNYIVSKVRPGTGTNPTTIAGTVVDITIENGKTYQIESNTTLTIEGSITNNGNLIIEDGGQLIIPNNTTVAATVQKNIADWTGSKGDADNWYAIATPVDDVTIASFVPTESGEKWNVYKYVEKSNYWNEYRDAAVSTELGLAPFTTLESGWGYIYRSTGGNIQIAGNVNAGNENGEVSLDLSFANSTNASLKGFNLLGNPFTHNITWNNLTVTKVNDEGCYLLDEDPESENHGKWVGTLKDDVTIAPMQAFFVQANDDNPSVTIKNTASVGGGDKSGNDMIMFAVKNSQHSDEAYVLFKEGHGLNKIEHRNAAIPMLYVMNNGENFAIADMSDDTRVINLGFEAKTMSQYSISLKAQGNFSYMHLYDKLTGEDVDMLVEDSYTFIGTPNDRKDRFVLRLTYNAAIEEVEANEVFVYQSGSDIIVNGEGELQVFDMMGRKVMTQHINGTETVNVNANGVYIFKMNDKVQKVVVR